MQSRRRRRRWVSDSGAINPHRAAFVLYRYYITLSRDSYAQIMGQERCDAMRRVTQNKSERPSELCTQNKILVIGATRL